MVVLLSKVQNIQSPQLNELRKYLVDGEGAELIKTVRDGNVP